MDILVSSILLCLSTVVKYLGYLSILVTYSLSSHILSKVNRDVIKYLHFFFWIRGNCTIFGKKKIYA